MSAVRRYQARGPGLPVMRRIRAADIIAGFIAELDNAEEEPGAAERRAAVIARRELVALRDRLAAAADKERAKKRRQRSQLPLPLSPDAPGDSAGGVDVPPAPDGTLRDEWRASRRSARSVTLTRRDP